MIRSTLVGVGTLGLVVGVGALSFHAGTQAAPATPVAQPEGEIDMEAMMKEMAKAAEPGEQHARLASAVGEWRADSEWMMGPDETTKSPGSMTVSSLLDGRFTLTKYKSDFNGAPFHGIGVHGYDNLKQEYVSVWMDNFGTGIMYMTGQPEGDTIVYHGASESVMGHFEMKMVTSHPETDKMLDTFYKKMDGEWVEEGTIRYSRVGHGMADD